MTERLHGEEFEADVRIELIWTRKLVIFPAFYSALILDF